MPSRNRSNLPDVTSLTAAHRGYEYQDLLVACRLVDMLLGTVVEARIDEKLTAADDRFDDLSLMLSFSNGSHPAYP